MKIWFDTEFIEDGRTIDPISIGMVREDGETYYAEFAEADLSKASLWVTRNVIKHLNGLTKPRHQIASEIVDFCGRDPEFWAYFADYDWVLLCQLYGRMIELPTTWPMFCMDVQQQWRLSPLYAEGLDPPPMGGTAHNAMHDAIWCKEFWEWLNAN